MDGERRLREEPLRLPPRLLDAAGGAERDHAGGEPLFAEQPVGVPRPQLVEPRQRRRRVARPERRLRLPQQRGLLHQAARLPRRRIDGPLLLTAEWDTIKAWAEVPIAAQIGETEIQGIVDGRSPSEAPTGPGRRCS
jgi:hypothetical protein